MAAQVKTNLHKERCLACDGMGVLFSSADPASTAWACPVCHGDGYVEPDCNMTLEHLTAVQKERWLPENQEAT